MLALSSLDLESHKHIVERSTERHARGYYNSAVSSLRQELTSSATAYNLRNDLLWCTALLGIFELMSDATGNGFLLHFVHGTSMLLQIHGPRHYLQHGGHRFFHLARMLEMIRAVVFWNGTFLEDIEWRNAGEAMSADEEATQVFESLNTLIIRVSSLIRRTEPVVLGVHPANLDDSHIDQLRSMTAEGFEIQRCLESWHQRLLSTTSPSSETNTPLATNSAPPILETSETDANARIDICSIYPTSTFISSTSLLSLLYYHAILMNLADIFTPFPHWTPTPHHFAPYPHFKCFSISIPIFPAFPHVNTILTLASHALHSTTQAGLLLLWPIRAAGTRATTRAQVKGVLELLHQVERRGFVVARTFEMRLRRQWVARELI